MKKTKIKQIPMFPTRYYDDKIGGWVYRDVLSHVDYHGETRWSDERTADGRGIAIEPTMVDNVPWEDELVYMSYYRGRSAAGGTFTNTKGQIFTVFMTDMDKFIPLMINGKIKGKFIYCKRGQNYGVTLYTGE
jgi:hypothetical protein